MESLDKNEIKTFYDQVENVWPENDEWHTVNQNEIRKYIHTFKLENCKVLNAGSGGSTYGLNIEMYHADIVENKIKDKKHYVVCSIEDMPFEDCSFDVVICVGSVINYCDPIKAITELSRVLKTNGIMILEFESSYSFEYRKTKIYRANANIVTTKYFDKPHKLWVYSAKYIANILTSNRISIIDTYSFHILSSLHYHYKKDESMAARYAKLDGICRHIPFVRKHAGNIILLGKKK